MKPNKKTAYHEAGHAVMAWHLGIPPKRASVVAAGDYVGYVEHSFKPPKGGMDLPPKRGERERLQDYLLVLLAGYSAESKFKPGCHSAGALDDFGRVASIAMDKFGYHDGTFKAYINFLKVFTRESLERLWPDVQAVAEALWLNKEMTGEAIKKLINERPVSV